MIIEKETRLESLKKLDKQKRYSQIREVLKNSKEALTAKEIANVLGFPERNYTAPRLTEMKIKGEVESVGKKYDYETDRLVTAYKLKEV